MRKDEGSGKRSASETPVMGKYTVDDSTVMNIDTPAQGAEQ
jgi:hypothetical protein